MSTSPIDKLVQAGVIKRNHKLPPHHVAAVNSLSDSETDALISAKKKLGDDLLEKHSGGPSADCFV